MATVYISKKCHLKIKKLRPFFVFCLLCSLCLQIFHRDSVVQKFHHVTVEIEAALSQIPYDTVEVSEEVREQVLITSFFFLGFEVDQSLIKI